MNACVLCLYEKSWYDLTLIPLSGAHRRTGSTSVQQTFRLRQLFKHEQFNMRQLRNDVALLQLERPIQASSKVNTVCVPSSGSRVPPGTQCYITGTLYSIFYISFLTKNYEWKGQQINSSQLYQHWMIILFSIGYDRLWKHPKNPEYCRSFYQISKSFRFVLLCYIRVLHKILILRSTTVNMHFALTVLNASLYLMKCHRLGKNGRRWKCCWYSPAGNVACCCSQWLQQSQWKISSCWWKVDGVCWRSRQRWMPGR